jgi:putative oxidoreductase
MNGLFPALATLVGRILLALMFVHAGYSKIGGFDRTVSYIAARGLPLPQAGAVGTIVLELAAGIALILGFKARWAAAVLVIFTLAAMYFFHAFWAMPAEQVNIQRLLFLKNIAVAGGLLFVVVNGPGALSIDGRRR